MGIVLAPASSQIKDTHLMATAHAVVTLPMHRRGSHPENQTLALDGRSRSMMASKGSVDQEEHKGSLYWIVSRTSVAKDANLEYENCTFQQQIKVTLPASTKKKKTHVCEFRPAELPTIPLLVNMKAIPNTHQARCVPGGQEKGRQGQEVPAEVGGLGNESSGGTMACKRVQAC